MPPVARRESDTEDYFVVRKTYGGDGVTGTLRDKVMGWEIDLISPGTQQQYNFFVTHKNVGFEFFLDEGVGGTGYSGIAKRGPIKLMEWTGPAFSQKSFFLLKNSVN